MSRNRQRPGRAKPHPASVQQMVSGPGPAVDALGKTWRFGFNTQNAKAALEELIRAHVIRTELKTKRAMGGQDGEDYWQNEVKPLLDSGYYTTFKPGWVNTLKSADGVVLFVQSLLVKSQPEVTAQEAYDIFQDEPEQTVAALEVVAPDFFVATAVQVGYSAANAKQIGTDFAAALHATLASRAAGTTPEPAT